jgi:hypothetical protein
MLGTALHSIFDRPVLLGLAGPVCNLGWYIGLHFKRKFPQKCHGSMAVCCLSNLSRNTDLDAVNDYARSQRGAFGQNIYDSSMVSR